MPQEYLLSLFKIRRGDFYSEEQIREGLNKARELYGAIGRFEFTAFPDLNPRDNGASPEVDVTMRVQEGTSTGSTGSRSSAIRRRATR